MFEVIVIDATEKRSCFFTGNTCRLGRASDNDIILPGWRTPRHLASITSSQGILRIRDVSDSGQIWVNEQRISDSARLEAGDRIRLAGCELRVQPGDRRKRARSAETAPSPDITAHKRDPDGQPMQPAVVQPVSTNGEHEIFLLHRKIHEQLLQTIDVRRADLNRLSDTELRRETEQLIVELVNQQPQLPQKIDRQRLVEAVLNEAIGLGPLESLLADDSISEIMVNGPDDLFVEKNGRITRCNIRFSSAAAVHKIIERIVTPLGRRIDESMPLVDARLRDGSRVNAIIPPLALRGPCLTIRKFAARRLELADLVTMGALSPAMVDFLQMCVVHRKNIVISGGTGSGKTTLLNVLSNLIPEGERIITIEDAAELQLRHDHLVTLESRPANLEGRGAIHIRDLVRNALRMRPDRIVVGECRGGEALDMLQAMNTGHDGSLTTAHANSPRDVLSRLETMVLMAGIDLPVMAIREQIASAIDIVVQQTRFACGARKVTHISEITGVEAGRIQLQDIFVFRQTGFHEDGRVNGYFSACGLVPSFYEQLARTGITIDTSVFTAEEVPWP